jgi:hypothetical protein
MMTNAAQLIAYPVKDLELAKRQFMQPLGAGPVVAELDSVGYRTDVSWRG